MSYNIDESYSFSASGTRIRPMFRGLGLFTGVPSAGDFSKQTGIPLDIAKNFLEKVWTGDPELQNIVKEMYDKYVPDSKKADMQKWLTAVGVTLPIDTPATAEAGRADVTSKDFTPDMKITFLGIDVTTWRWLGPLLAVGGAAYLYIRKR